ncbi:RNA polymerase sporulation sigma factor SigF [Clostridium luticellarii]|jgi:RNA polymerase sporulation-specific sigma factor|uniref:RNA polymerase sigma-F factor n=1 Tax=Clostridium luticellarii TaxID=1691940 RepID=A0A2T0BLL3_9CLOT|nr:RNA polymerase sporulation sigma factor SigF [Clostridium luticellarii]MCI1944309.1 RNA polymerase sporulation sigma factor SigF [Clostridium luticellarii]MCI1967805.1 RNA polymerase sporulation sigma factor SigF [Clostridium luticellarii]MCI1994683.1 RNA polymerase sporulation sigma factor SigF [Clostridium luticellarii]MCI2038820.1 RNA polymerase sporulation sigma factor SigF [Clostridium luticellarii]PRR84767.1 RNA polymerase sigma-F factor [Clostridium luticellarii]
MNEEAVKKLKCSYEDNLELIKYAQQGDKDALDKLVKLNLPLVSAISKKFLNRGYEYEDIFQIGCMGLMKAVNNFDPGYNVKFSTYAVPMILGEIKRFLRDDGMIKVSRSVKNTAKKLHYDRETLTKKLNREPTVEELAKYSGVEVEDLIFATESATSLQYLYDTIHQDDGSPVLLIDKISQNPNEDVEMVDRIALKEALKNLDVKSRQIIMLRYFKDKTQIQVAKMLGINQVQVSRIEKKVLKSMREILGG